MPEEEEEEIYMGDVKWPEGAWFVYRSPYGSLVRGEAASGNRDQHGNLDSIESTRGVSYALHLIELEPQAEWTARMRARKISDLGL